jgi:type IV secretory pathway VirB10-like protein
MRISTAYFAGVGTVIVAVGAGLGGGYLAANVTNPPTQTISKLERRMSAEPITVATAPAEPVPHVAATNPTAAPPVQEQTQPQQHTPQPQQQTEAAAPSANNVRAEEKTANNAAVAQPIQPPPQPAKSTEQADEKTAAARDVRARDADIKRADAEKRRAERRQRWADKRRFQQTREQELEAVESSVREVTEPRRIRIREEAEPRDLFAERARPEMPRIRLFDQDD